MTYTRYLLSAATVLTYAAFADAPQSTVQAQSQGVLPEIVVTARKREENIQNIPITVNVFTSDMIDNTGITDMSRLSDFTPNFSFEKFGGRRGAEGDTSRPVIRGQSNILGEGNASFFVDGILYSESILSFPIDAVERVEVVKGPQAALFGRSTFSGAINIITKRGTNEFQNRITARAASHNDYEVNLSSSGPIVKDKLFYFFQTRYYDYGGEYRNQLDGKKVGQENSYGFNGSLEFRPNPDVTLIGRWGYNRDMDGLAATRVQDRFANNCFLDQARQYFCGEVTKFNSVILNKAGLKSEAGLEREVTRASLTLEWDLGGSGYVLTSNSGLTFANSTFGNDQTNLGDPIGFAGGIFTRVEDMERREWSTELRIASPEDKRFRYMVGGYYYSKDKQRVRRFPDTTTIITDFGTSTVRNVAVFGFTELDVTESITARAELRWQSDEIGLHQASGTVLKNTFNKVLPRFTLDYQVTDSTLLYAVAAKGDKPGAFNTDPSLPASARTAGEETAWNYEGGVKWASPNGRIRVTADGFYINWKNQQLTNSILVAGVPISFISNAGKTRVFGVELEGNALITNELEVGGSFGYANAEFVNNCDPVQGSQLTGFDCVSNTGIPGGSVKGHQTPNSPRTQIAVNATYTRPIIGDMDWFLRADYSYRSKIFAQVHNLAFAGDRHLLNLKTGLKQSKWKMTFFVNNVLDDLTPSTIVRFADLGNLNIGPQANPAQNNVPGSTVVERGFLVPLADGRRFGVTASLDF